MDVGIAPLILNPGTRLGARDELHGPTDLIPG